MAVLMMMGRKGMRDEEKCWEVIGQLSCVLMGFQESWDFASSVAPGFFR